MTTRSKRPPDARSDASSEAPASRWRRSAPVITLLLLSPIIGEVLFGATRITTLFVLLPQVGTWGCAALLIREMVRRQQGGWPAILLLGMALAVAEECLIQQTSLAPLLGVDPQRPYGRSLGVNWVYFLWAVGYESIWIVVLPIQVTDLMYPDRRDEPWLGTRGRVIAMLVFAIASFVAWYSWTQLYVPQFFPELAYRPPLASMLIAIATILGLAATAIGLQQPSLTGHRTSRSSPRPWLIGLAALALALPWFTLVFLAYGAMPDLPTIFPLAGGLALAVFAFFIVSRWSRCFDWGDSSRLALIIGGLFASMLAGFPILTLGGAPIVDIVGKLFLDLFAVILLVRLGCEFANL